MDSVSSGEGPSFADNLQNGMSGPMWNSQVVADAATRQETEYL